MTQLWAWKYEGQDKVGHKIRHLQLVTQNPDLTFSYHYEADVTDLHKVKVVDENAVVMPQDASFKMAVNQAWDELGNLETRLFPHAVEVIKIRQALMVLRQSILPTPSVQEPKGFPHWIHVTNDGDPFLCKAKYHIQNCKFSLDRHFLCECREESMHKSHLINPVILSEGVGE